MRDLVSSSATPGFELFVTFILQDPYIVIALDKSGYQKNVFLIFSGKHMLWVLIRSTLQRHF